jgi:hypothetical protein
MSDYVRVEDGRIVEGPGPCPKVMPGINGFDRFKPQEQAKHGWFPFTAGSEPEHDPNTQKVVWRVAFGPVVTSYATVEPLTDTEVAANLDARRQALLERNADLRWQREVGGIEFLGYPEREAPIPIHTDRDSQITIFAAALRGQNEAWKGMDGNWYPISAHELALLSESIAQHKRACFQNEAAVAVAIHAAETFAELDQIDLELLWSPSE